MKKKIQFSLVYRDMWQSSGKFQPRKDQLAKIAPVIIEMGCFSRVETNGGAFEQVNLLAGENPNDAVRAFLLLNFLFPKFIYKIMCISCPEPHYKPRHSIPRCKIRQKIREISHFPQFIMVSALKLLIINSLA